MSPMAKKKKRPSKNMPKCEAKLHKRHKCPECHLTFKQLNQPEVDDLVSLHFSRDANGRSNRKVEKGGAA